MKKRITLLFICFAVALLIISCSLFENTKTGSVIFQINAEQLRSAVNARNADFENALIIDISLEGDYSDSKSLKIPFEGQEPGDFPSASIEPQEIHFDSVPVGSEITAKARIYKYYKDYNDKYEEKQLIYKGTSETIKTKAGDNYLTIKALDAFKDFPFTITISFAEDSVNPMDEGFTAGNTATPGTVTVYAIKADSPLLKKYYEMFKNRDCGRTDVSEFRRSFDNGENGDSDGLWDFSSIDVSSFHTTDTRLVIEGNLWLETDVDYVLVAVGEFNREIVAPYNEDPYKGVYFFYPNGASFDKFSSKKVTPSAKGTSLDITLSKVTPETGYLSYIPNNTTGNIEYDMYSGASVKFSNLYYYHDEYSLQLISDEFKIDTLDRKSFAFDSHGMTYVYGKDQDGNSKIIKLGNSSDPETFSAAGFNLDSITVDSSNDALYGIMYGDGDGKLYQLSQTDPIQNVQTYTFSLNDYSKNYNDGSFVVFNKTLYIPVKTIYGFYLYTARLDGNNDLSLTSKNLTGSFDLASNSNTKVTDVIHQGDYLYVLLRAYKQDHDSRVIEARGALVRINLKDKDYSVKVVGYNNTEEREFRDFNSYACLTHDDNYKVLYSGNSIYDGRYIHHFTDTDTLIRVYANDDKNVKSNFAGPAKILAIKPKKLYIADSGFIFYEDEADNRLRSPNLNRIITIDLEQLSLEDADFMVPVLSTAGVYDRFEFEPIMPYADLSWTTQITEEGVAFYDNGGGEDNLVAAPLYTNIIPSLGD